MEVVSKKMRYRVLSISFPFQDDSRLYDVIARYVKKTYISQELICLVIVWSSLIPIMQGVDTNKMSYKMYMNCMKNKYQLNYFRIKFFYDFT